MAESKDKIIFAGLGGCTKCCKDIFAKSEVLPRLVLHLQLAQEHFHLSVLAFKSSVT